VPGEENKMINANETRIRPEMARAFIAEVLATYGLPDIDAARVAEFMVRADLLGGDGHGLFRLPSYVKRLLSGGYNKTPSIRVDRDAGASVRIDGDNAMGHLVVGECVDIAMERAALHGVAWVGCHNSNHAGIAGTYALLPTDRDMIGIYVAVGSANHMAPWGGTELLLSTNPIAIGIPGGDGGPVLLDMATTEAAYGKVKLAAQRGETMPEGWMIDAEGKPLTDPTRTEGGSLLPIGGPKGYGLALMFGILAGTLNGAAFGRDVIDFNADFESTTNTGQFVIALDVAKFMDPAGFRAQIDALRDEMKSSPLRPGFDSIRLPGERALGLEKDRTANGIPLRPELLAALRPVANAAGVTPIEERT
jgi:LDH2 family malate/lactate/ureidoglycolate dehydrogenase